MPCMSHRKGDHRPETAGGTPLGRPPVGGRPDGRRRRRGAGSFLAALLLIIALGALAAGCGGDSAQRSVDQEAGSDGGSSENGAEPVQGTTSSGPAESTVGVVEPEMEPTRATEKTAEAANSESTGSENAGSEVSEPETAGPAPGNFVASPEDSGGSGYGADSLLGVRFGDHGNYERVVVDLGSGAQPASGVPSWTLSSPTGDGRLKLSLPSVRSTEVSDGSLEGAGAELLDSFYVVRAPDGGMFVDIFARRAFYYRVVELSDPSRLAIDFKPAGSELDIPLPVKEGNTVLTEPRTGDSIGSPVTVSGYSRNPEASNTISLQGPEGQTLARETVLSNDWSSTWGYFETTLDFQPFSGEGTLKAGTRSARDGSFEGVELPVEQEQ